MKRLQGLAVLFLAVYLLFTVGVSFHSDNDEWQIRSHCNLCQAAHLSFVQTPNWYGPVGFSILGFTESFKPTIVSLTYHAPHSGRAPPTA